VAVERLLRASGAPGRFAWLGAMAGTLGLLAAVPLRLAVPGPGAVAEAGPVSADAVSLLIGAPVSAAAAATGQWPAWVGPALAGAWILTSVTAGLLFAAAYRRHRRTVATAARGTLAGTEVRIAESFGPAVIGVRHPWIVVPRWLLARDAGEQRLVVQHERSHIESRDPLLLLAGCAAVVAMPWNPVLWAMLARLRLATELDCDARVLRAGAPPRTYGSLLIDLTASLPRPRLGAPAFACRPSHLERRLLAMTARPASAARRRARLTTAAGVAAAALLAACAAELPTAADVEAMDVAEVEERATLLRAIDVRDATYVVDGVLVERAVADAIVPERIASIEVVRGQDTPSRIVVTTVDGEVRGEPALKEPFVGEVERRRVPLLRTDGVVRPEGTPTVVLRADTLTTDGPAPLVVVDGVIVSGALGEIDAKSIEKVEVVKGPAARRLYGERAATGVILITTRKP
jgi:TonB-dependent SusC/RagA subfamily outer membrane receptor